MTSVNWYTPVEQTFFAESRFSSCSSKQIGGLLTEWSCRSFCYRFCNNWWCGICTVSIRSRLFANLACFSDGTMKWVMPSIFPPTIPLKLGVCSLVEYCRSRLWVSVKVRWLFGLWHHLGGVCRRHILLQRISIVRVFKPHRLCFRNVQASRCLSKR